MLLVVFVLLVAVVAGAFPVWPHSRSYGYGPSFGAGIALVLVLLWAVAGRHRIF